MEEINYTFYYSKWHPPTKAHRNSMVAFYASLLHAHFGEISGHSVLDVGCGMGFAMEACKNLGCRSVVGIDVDRGQCELAKASGLNVEHIPETVPFLLKHESEYDIVLCMDVIEHVEVADQLGFCRSILRSVRSGGAFLCTVPNANSSFAARWRYNDWTHRSSFTEHSLEFLLQTAGFRSIRVTGMEFYRKPPCTWLPISGARHWWAFRFFRMLRRMEAMAELGPQHGRHMPLSLNLLATAKKF